MIDFYFSPRRSTPSKPTIKNNSLKIDSRPSTNMSDRRNASSKTKLLNEVSQYYSTFECLNPYESDSFIKCKLNQSKPSKKLHPGDSINKLPELYKNVINARI